MAQVVVVVETVEVVALTAEVVGNLWKLRAKRH